jgi:hypothetical protein
MVNFYEQLLIYFFSYFFRKYFRRLSIVEVGSPIFVTLIPVDTTIATLIPPVTIAYFILGLNIIL